jgi:AcrR family transcriptional regulator
MRKSSKAMSRILAAAKLELGSKGLDGANIEQIAKTARTSKQLIYHYFENKQDLYRVVVSKSVLNFFANVQLGAFEDNDPTSYIRQFFLRVYDEFHKNPTLTVISIDQSLHAGAHLPFSPKLEFARTHFIDSLRPALELGKRRGLFRDDLNESMVFFISISMIVGTLSLKGIYQRFLGPELDRDDVQWRKLLAELFMNALRPSVPDGGGVGQGT